MSGLIILITVGLYFSIGVWGFKGVLSQFGTGFQSLFKAAKFLLFSATIGLLVSFISFSFYSGETIHGFSLMAGYAIKCPLIVLLPFLILNGIYMEENSLRCGYLSKAIAVSLSFSVIYYFLLINQFTSYFDISPHS